MTEFCCKKMEVAINDKYLSLEYSPKFRSYGLRVLDGGEVGARQSIYYCPWCGSKLPRDLGDELWDILVEELGLDGFTDKKIPKEYKSDEWWKKRNL